MTLHIGRRCLVPGCRCVNFEMDMEKYSESEEALESNEPELEQICRRCGHQETEHEMVPDETQKE